MRVVLQYTKQGAMKYVSHLDFQRLWRRLFRMADIAVANTQGFNPLPRMRFAAPLPTGFASCNELMEVFLAAAMDLDELLGRLNRFTPQGMDILAATPVPDSFPKLTALVDALEYSVELPECRVLPSAVEDCVPGGSTAWQQFVLAAELHGRRWRLLLASIEQKTLRPDVLVRQFFPEFDHVAIIRTGIFTRNRNIKPVPQGLSLLID